MRITKKMRTSLPYQSKGGRGVGRIEIFEGEAKITKDKSRIPYREEVKLCIERARLVTAKYMETEGEAMVLRRAKAMAHYLDNRKL